MIKCLVDFVRCLVVDEKMPWKLDSPAPKLDLLAPNGRKMRLRSDDVKRKCDIEARRNDKEVQGYGRETYKCSEKA